MNNITASITAIAVLSLTACSGDDTLPEEDKVTETRMDEVEVIDGTISDDMADVDTLKSGDQLADGEKSDSDGEEDKSDDETSSDGASEE